MMTGDGVVLNKAAFVYLLSLVATRTVIGLDDNFLAPAGATGYQITLKEGAASLEQAGWARRHEGGYAIDDGLALMAAIIAAPQQVVMTTEEGPAGRRLFLYYLCDGQIVELTLPNEQQVRLALLAGQSALLDRVSHILPVPPADASSYHVVLAKDSFLRVKSLALTGQKETAVALLGQHQLNSEVAGLLLDALTTPQGGGTLAAMRCQGKRVVDGHNLALIRGRRAAWLVSEPEPDRLRLETARPGTPAAFLNQSLKALSI